MDADCAGLGKAVHAPYSVEKLVLADSFAAVLHEIFQQFEFLCVELQHLIVAGDAP